MSGAPNPAPTNPPPPQIETAAGQPSTVTALGLAQKLKARFEGLISEPTEFRAEITLRLSDIQRIAEICSYAKTELGFDYLVDITSLDNYGEDPRFTLVYHLYGYGHLKYLRLKGNVSEEAAEVPTLTGVWRTADWHEREIYDMMGIRFKGHPDLRRIIMWEGYPYFPLRKDFPLSGRPSEMPEVAFTQPAPLAGGPFVTIAGGKDTVSREPRVRIPDTDAVEMNARLERRRDIKGAHGEARGPGPIQPKKERG
ncbi:MAG TPA: NADH-quinone oxidoreductase subunit C [Candidatus Limnocylindrales bacterium]|jgi:NADH-quinone oxidoreductase subunit C|nr:NADH-quinone oxidoreductase subunit C [Candidatus Limnocylindrales bacterium]